jgi:hypothetical protein
MKSSRWALTVLDRFGVDAALVGDVIEQREQHGRLWLWRQVAVALAAGLMDDVRRHPLAAALTVAGAFASRLAMTSIWRPIEPSLDMYIAGVIVEHIQLSRPTLIALVGPATALMNVPIWCATGWLFSRLRRPRLLLLFCVSVWALLLAGDVRQLAHAAANPGFAPYRIAHVGIMLFWLLAFTISTLAGGLAWRRGSSTARGAR